VSGRAIRAVAVSCYRFVVGDDWACAAAVLAGLAGTALVAGTGNPAWWVLPLAVVVALPISLRRAGAASRRPPRSAPGPR
jgi:hypothetical protein